MKFHVTVRTFDHITGENQIARLRENIGQKIRQFKESGKMIDGAVFIDKRGAYFIFDCDSEEELFRLLTPMQDHSHIELHPLVSFETMQNFFERERATQESLN